jgi:hypothetical protein
MANPVEVGGDLPSSRRYMDFCTPQWPAGSLLFAGRGSRRRLKRYPHLCQEIVLFVRASDFHAPERAVQPDVGVKISAVLVEMQEGSGSPAEITALALLQLRKFTQLRQQHLYLVKVLLSRMPHMSRMTLQSMQMQPVT